MADRRPPPEPDGHHSRRDRLGFRRVAAIRSDPGGALRVACNDGARRRTVRLAEWDAWVEPHRAAPDRFVVMCAARARA